MGQALLIRNMDFSANKLKTLRIITPKPCLAVSLNTASLTFNHVGDTAQLVATLYPEDTTDAVVWASSDPSVVRVVDGLVTQVGIGEATISAVCGGKVAECEVTATYTLTYTTKKSVRIIRGADSGPYDYVYLQAYEASYCAVYNLEPPTKYWVNVDGATTIEAVGTDHVYPIPLGENAAQINITTPSTVRVTCWLLNSDEMCDYGKLHPSIRQAHYAKRIWGDANSWDGTVAKGNRTIQIANYVRQGANSVIFCFQHASGTVTDEDLAGTTITITGGE